MLSSNLQVYIYSDFILQKTLFPLFAPNGTIINFQLLYHTDCYSLQYGHVFSLEFWFCVSEVYLLNLDLNTWKTAVNLTLIGLKIDKGLHSKEQESVVGDRFLRSANQKRANECKKSGGFLNSVDAEIIISRYLNESTASPFASRDHVRKRDSRLKLSACRTLKLFQGEQGES